MISKRVDRTIRLLHLLQQHDGISLQEIADLLNCSRRTVYRDLHVLRERGFRIEWSDDGYQVAGAGHSPQGFIDGGEMLALLIAIHSTPHRDAGGFLILVRRALQKLMTTAADDAQDRWSRLSQSISVAPDSEQASLSPADVNALSRVAIAIEASRELTWVSQTRTYPQKSAIIPNAIVAQDNIWYIQGHDPLSGLPLQIELSSLETTAADEMPVGPVSFPIALPVTATQPLEIPNPPARRSVAK